MVAIIHSSKSLRNALHYNENKVRQKIANFIHAGNYPKDTHQLGFNDKINRLKKLTELNQQTKINSVHISLNFDQSDVLNEDVLKGISDKYLQAIGFGEQPYLVYQHNDSGHPHIHIVTTNIKHDGSRISLHNLGRNQSEKARKEIEKEFKLIPAQQQHSSEYTLKPVDVAKVQYGKTETKRAITNVLDYVLPNYKYASLAELNAVLRQYNVAADRGTDDSRIYKSKGLLYRLIDANGKKTGVPIKASLIYSKPTLKRIEENFERNEVERQKYKRRVTNAVDLLLLKKENHTLSGLLKALQQQNIQVTLRQNEDGIIYGITYVDHTTKCVFNGSYLGKQYSANAIMQRCGHTQAIALPSDNMNQSVQPDKQHQQTTALFNNKGFNTSLIASSTTKLFEDVLQPEENRNANEPFEQKKFKRKRKRKQQQSHN